MDGTFDERKSQPARSGFDRLLACPPNPGITQGAADIATPLAGLKYFAKRCGHLR